MRYKVTSNQVIEKDLWQFDDGRRVSLERGLEWGNIILSGAPDLESYDKEQGVSVWTSFNNLLETNRGSENWKKWVYFEDLTNEEKETIESTWLSESSAGLEKIGWTFIGKRLWFYGSLEVKEI